MLLRVLLLLKVRLAFDSDVPDIVSDVVVSLILNTAYTCPSVLIMILYLLFAGNSILIYATTVTVS